MEFIFWYVVISSIVFLLAWLVDTPQEVFESRHLIDQLRTLAFQIATVGMFMVPFLLVAAIVLFG